MGAEPASNPYVFIVGCARSGTTLLERMLNAHPELAIIHETHWITRFYEKPKGLTKDALVRRKLIARVCGHHRFRNLHMSRSDVTGLLGRDEALPYASFIKRLFELYGAREGKRLVGDKTTGNYIRKLPLLAELFPQARFVHLLRDGCVATLFYRWLRDVAAVSTGTAFRWRGIATIVQAGIHGFPGQFFAPSMSLFYTIPETRQYLQ
jgi:hypothetical protein